METNEYDPTPREMSPVRRYYTDLKYVEGNYVDLQIATQKFVASELDMPEHGLSQLYGDILPTAELHSMNRRAAMEMMMIFPIELVGSYIELTRSEQEISEWYTEAAKQIRLRTAREHTASCYVQLPGREEACYTGDRCPRRVLSYALVTAPNPDFGSLEYAVDPVSTYNTVLAKLEVARRSAMITNEQHMVLYDRYTYEFERQFGTLPQTGENPA